jgi:SAM-dependent methyltransferase
VSGTGCKGTTVEECLAPFDAVAESYDREFTHTLLGRELRARVWQQLAARFPAGSRVLELNCGTGEDAAWLARCGVEVVATDVSNAMLAVAKRKTVEMTVEVRRLDLAYPEADFHPGLFDGAFSNFGGLNCVADLRPLARVLSLWLKPGAALIVVVMGPICLWEMAWYLLHGEPRAACRRWARGGTEARVGKRTVKVYYPWPGEVARAFAPAFRRAQLTGLGVTLPPTTMAATMERYKGLLRRLSAIEKPLARVWPLSSLGDHYILEMERCP